MTHPSQFVKILWLTIISVLLIFIPSFATDTFRPVYKPSIEIKKTDETVKIDGILDDSVWKSAGHATNFVERNPGDMIQPEVETEAFITYNDEYIYVAYICYDDPSTIRATMCQRDQFAADDAAILLLDTYGDATWAYQFFVNPYGIQKDVLWTSIQGQDLGFDLIWNSAATITDKGYQVEIAIPFSSMRFPKKDIQSWKIDFWRNRPRESYFQYSWAAYDRNEQCWPCQWGTVEGINNVFPGKGFEVLPTFIANHYGALKDEADPKSDFHNERVRGDFSLGGKYSVSSDITIEAAINPDFSQVEADADQIDVNTTIALFYPEKRPFFQEGSDLFQTLFNSFYTRTVNDPEFVAKLTARTEGLSVGFMSALDNTTPYIIPLDDKSIPAITGKSYVNVLRALKSFHNNSKLGLIVTDRRFVGKEFDGNGYGTVIGLDGDIRLSKNYSIVGQVLRTYNKEPNDSLLTWKIENQSWPPFNADTVLFGQGKHNIAFDGETFAGGGVVAEFRRQARHWNFTIDYNHVSPTYRTETGFDPWVNYHSLFFYTSYHLYFEQGLLERITPQVYTDRRWTFDDELRWRNLDFAIEGRFRFAQTYFNLFYGTAFESWNNVDFDNLWNVDFTWVCRPTNRSEINFNVGQALNVARGVKLTPDYQVIDVKGKETRLNISLNLKPFDRIIIEPSINYAFSKENSTGDKLYKQLISRTKLKFQATKALSLRLVLQYNDTEYYSFAYESKRWDLDPLLTYQISPFSIFYIGSTMDYRHFNEYNDLNNPNNSFNEQWKMSSRQFFMKLQYLFQT